MHCPLPIPKRERSRPSAQAVSDKPHRLFREARPEQNSSTSSSVNSRTPTDPGSLQVTPDFRIFFNIHETEDQPLRKRSNTVTDTTDLLQQVLNGYHVGEDQGIKPPDHPAFPDSVGEPDECFNTLADRRHARFEPFGIVIVQREQEVITITQTVERIEMGEEWCRVL